MSTHELENLPVEFLFTERARLTEGIHKLARGPFGRRYLVPAVTGTFEGSRLRGALMPGLCNDFATVMANEVVDADVRVVMQTDDGSVILAAASGRHSLRYRGSQWPESWRLAMTFEVAPGPYEWLNEVVAVGIGRWRGPEEAETKIYALS